VWLQQLVKISLIVTIVGTLDRPIVWNTESRATDLHDTCNSMSQGAPKMFCVNQ
jgi:hypothetical protein